MQEIRSIKNQAPSQEYRGKVGLVDGLDAVGQRDVDGVDGVSVIVALP